MTTHPPIRPRPLRRPRPLFAVHESFWGYVIRGTDGPPVFLQVAQGIVLAFAAGFTAAALVIVLLPSAPASEGADGVRALLSTTLGSVALLLLWFATRGGAVEFHVDLAQGELRELVRHRVGPATLLGRHGFGGGLSLRVERGRRAAALVLRLPGDERGRVLARGCEAALGELRRRLEADLMLSDHVLRRPGPDAATAARAA